MPLVKINVRKGRPRAEIEAISDAIHEAVVEALRVPVDDRNQRIYEFSEEDFQISSEKSGKYTLIEMSIFPGRSLMAKKNLYQGINRRLIALGYDNPRDIVIVLNEPSLENWGILGGIPASEANLSFKLDV